MALGATEAAMASGNRALFEPAFLHENVFIRIDILRPNDDATDEIAALLPSIPGQVSVLNSIIRGSHTPNVQIGRQCESPYTCQFKEHCWRHVTEPSIFTIPRVGEAKIDQLVSQGTTSIFDIPEDFHLSDNQRSYVEMLSETKSLLCTTRFISLTSRPRRKPCRGYPGSAPFSQYPFQFSLHLLHDNGDLDHFAYLHSDTSDPRTPLAEALVDRVGPSGTIIAYNTAFEKSVISNLAKAIPSLTEDLGPLLKRFFDLLPIFRNYYIHPAFHGSSSIKNVLPVLVPDLSYSELNISEGSSAQVAPTGLGISRI
jgi:hypothetical protein